LGLAGRIGGDPVTSGGFGGEGFGRLRPELRPAGVQASIVR